MYVLISGTPFSDMSRSNTLPNASSSSTLSTSISSSFKNLTKSSAGLSSRFSSLKKSYLASSPAAYEKTQKAMAGVRSAYSSAASVVSKRVEEIREAMPAPPPGGLAGVGTPVMSPAGSYQYLSAPAPSEAKRDEDANSNCSENSRFVKIFNCLPILSFN